MITKRKLINFFIYISLFFLLITLYKNAYFKIPQIYSGFELIISILFLFGAFVLIPIIWKKILQFHHVRISLSQSISACGLSIFGKYIPGKIWIILGQSAYVSNLHSNSLQRLSVISIENMMLNVWTGLIFGAIGLFYIGGLNIWGWITLSLWIVLSIALFTPLFHKLTEQMLKALLKKPFNLPSLSFKSILKLLPIYIIHHLFFTVGFYFFVEALIPSRTSFLIGFGFPLAGSLGIVAFFAPGGLGVREGFLVGYLNIAGLSLPTAITISVASRIWFLLAETILFLAGLILDRYYIQKTNL